MHLNVKCHHYCSRAGVGLNSHGDAFLLDWGRGSPSVVCLFPNSHDTKSPREDCDRKGNGNPHSPFLATSELATFLFCMSPHAPYPLPSRRNLLIQEHPGAPSLRPPLSHSMARNWFQDSALICSQQVKHVLLHSRRPTTQSTDWHKWRRFGSWCAQNNLDLTSFTASLTTYSI